jgi:hypothetical protein
LGHWLDDASGTVILDFAAKYFPMILPFIPIMDAVLMTRSAIITGGILFVMMAINWVSAKMLPRPRDTTQNCETSLYRFLYKFGFLGPDNPIKRPATTIAAMSRKDGR